MTCATTESEVPQVEEGSFNISGSRTRQDVGRADQREAKGERGGPQKKPGAFEMKAVLEPETVSASLFLPLHLPGRASGFVSS